MFQPIKCLREIQHLRALERAGLVSIEMPASNFLFSYQLTPAQQRELEPAMVRYEKACLLLEELTDAIKISCLCAVAAMLTRYFA
ncbi:hypothetical protein C6380_12810 [Pseudomonas syringae pv. actinidiae]|uniref:hypothetical protein n=1 Tax=Pseudomonas syringae TaxID=317 RepID=UPI000BB54E03|nr:hypothetical protein [Pseudomonas syringae]PBK49094.1 hypothetical protein BUE61_23990 [Pseudomonas syringae pv. actinidiae]PBK49133.1 hypothetical protein BUE60_25095 [Pseudomonas syringae pv. actinidiae]RJX55228.1 hypothetical protein C6383_24760 [Pseudomonas syringae pv. actinidiae]RJX56381.1 hypothetical protein C6380_12810 [Pseudomonas syringae pv. actinidiae]RJX60631.1 hypothetical protein C6379_05845 [Pseudomonas syringae pv. actinidiae]